MVLFECEFCHVQHSIRSWCGSAHRYHQPTCPRYAKQFEYDLSANVCVEEEEASQANENASPTTPSTTTTTLAAKPSEEPSLVRCRYCFIEHPIRDFCASVHRDHLPTCERFSPHHRFDFASGRVLAVKPVPAADPDTQAAKAPTAELALSQRWHLAWGGKVGKHMCGHCGVTHQLKAFCVSMHQGMRAGMMRLLW